jgi:hypothetical protein
VSTDNLDALHRHLHAYELGDQHEKASRAHVIAAQVRPVLEELAQLRDADGLARDALRRAGYHFSADAGVPLAGLIDNLNADARDAVRACGEESKRLRDRLSAAHDALTRVEDDDPDEFVTLESTVEWVVRSYRATSEEHDRLWRMVGDVHTLASVAAHRGVSLNPAEVLAALEGAQAGDAA